MKKIRLTNTWKHAAVGIAVGAIVSLSQMLIHWIDSDAIFELGWFSVCVFVILAIAWESSQGWKRWLDSAIDLIAGIGSFLLALWAGGAI